MNFDDRSSYIIANTAMSWYLGEVDSATAFAQMDAALLSWNYDPAMLNASRELFDLFVDAALDFDLDRPVVPAYDTRLRPFSVEEYDRIVVG